MIASPYNGCREAGSIDSYLQVHCQLVKPLGMSRPGKMGDEGRASGMMKLQLHQL